MNIEEDCLDIRLISLREVIVDSGLNAPLEMLEGVVGAIAESIELSVC